MFDVVWIKVTVVKNDNPYSADSDGVHYVMFGPGGITKFVPHKTGSQLFRHKSNMFIEESPEYLMEVLGKIRRTAGVVNEQESEEREEEESQGSTSASKAESSL